MASGAISGHGTLLKRGNGATPEVFTTIAEVASISGPALAQETIDVTSHDSTDGWREFIGGLLDGGEVSFDVHLIPTNATHDNLWTDLSNRTLRNFQLVFPDGGATTWAFSALVTGFSTNEPIDSQLSASVSLKISGKPTLT